MTDRNPMLARRTVIKGAGLGLVAGALVDASSAQSSDCVVGMAQPQIWSSEYWAKKGDVPLWMYRKRLGEPKPGESARPVLFFVHGSAGAARGVGLKGARHRQ